MLQEEGEPTYSMADLVQACRAGKLLVTAIRLDLFTLLARGARTAGETARRLRRPQASTAAFLDALTEVGYLRKKDDRYSNTVFSQRYLVSGSPSYIGEDVVRQSEQPVPEP